MEERILVRKAKEGDTESFARLYEQVYKKMYQYAFYTLRSEEDAKDVVSDTVMDAFEQIGQLKSEEAFNVWIFRILVNKCKSKMRDYYIVTEDIEENEHSSAEDISDNIHKSLDIREGMSRLDKDEQQIINMHVILGYKTREIAVLLNMNENTVRSKESRALARLKNILKDWRS